VGRSSAKNHELTFRVAKGSDLWLHAREVEGAHVVVRLRRDEQLPADALLDAAHLAVHFSRARDESIVDVQYTNVGQLKKLPTPGAVILKSEKVIAVRIDKARTQTLLATER
jgi:predicted ribosome quality control (RQC) complex YloA/Tae2 family protein